MIFKILLKNGKNLWMDNINCILSETPLEKKYIDENFLEIKKSRNINHLRIQLGTKCNYRCGYCIQNTNHFKESKNIEYSRDKSNFFWKILNENLKIEKDTIFEFWGGEPFIYWDYIEDLTEKIREIFPENKILMISNGSLVDKRKIDFLNENKFNLKFSHDGFGQFIRGKDPLNDSTIFSLWKYTKDIFGKRFRINSVINNYNYDLEKLDYFFVNKFGYDIDFRLENFVIHHDKISTNYSFFDEKKKEILINSSLLGAIGDYGRCKRIFNFYKSYVNRLEKNFKNNQNLFKLWGKCDAFDEKSLSVTLDGSVITCHNVNPEKQSVGNLKTLETNRYRQFIHWSKRKKCFSCCFLPSCIGNCMRVDNSLFEMNCDSLKIMHFIIFNIFIFKKFGSFIEKFEKI